MSTRPSLEVADVIRAHGAAFLAVHGAALTGAQHRALGGHVGAFE